MVVSTLDLTLTQLAQGARGAANALAAQPSSSKNAALERMATLLREHEPLLLEANAKDLDGAREKSLSTAMLDRLRLTPERINQTAESLREVASFDDPVGEISQLNVRPNGLQIGHMRIPLGVVFMIYESRPNVTADAAALCLKSGNAVILRGGSEAFESNRAIVSLWQRALEQAGLPSASVQFVATTDRAALDALLQMEEWIDLVIPRGGEGLIRRVVERSKIPVIKHYKGVCHLYVDAFAKLDMAVALTLNGKVQRPGVCNALETLLVHEEVAADFLPEVWDKLKASGVSVRGCPQTKQFLPDVERADDSDWPKEYLDLVLAVKVVASVEQAIEHIERYGSSHTEAIVTENYTHAQTFLRQVNSSCVLVNASTRFNDGGQLGLGTEIGISTSKLHAFGPMGLRELTTQKFIVLGQGQVRP